MPETVRVRFAPSPTGELHLGGARTALFNWLFARKHQGMFVLRVEDTDEKRNTPAAKQAIYDGLRWLGIHWDEGPDAGGDYGPYFQSERNAIYQSYLEKLDAAGFLYEDEGAIRFRSDRNPMTIDDLVCGRITVDRSNEPDMTLRRPDGSFIFHFTNVVDDIEMKLTHVIRGEDHLTNTAKHLELFQALGEKPPLYAHIPLILNPDGSKMKKRDIGATVGYFMQEGFVPEGVANYICLLGWSPKDNREKIDMSEIVQLFELEKINRKAAAFDIDKCSWLSVQYLLSMTPERFRDLSLPFIQSAGITYGSAQELLDVLNLVKQKVKSLKEVPQWIYYFFTEDYTFDEAAVEKTLKKPGATERLTKLADYFRNQTEWTAEAIESALKKEAEAQGCKPAELIHPTRLAVSGTPIGPSLYHMLEVMGKDRVISRMEKTAQRFSA